jgi:hypothetical protein
MFLLLDQSFADFNNFMEGQLKKVSKLDGIGQRYCLTKFPTVQVALDRAPQIEQFLLHAWDRFQRPTKVCGGCLFDFLHAIPLSHHCLSVVRQG